VRLVPTSAGARQTRCCNDIVASLDLAVECGQHRTCRRQQCICGPVVDAVVVATGIELEQAIHTNVYYTCMLWSPHVRHVSVGMESFSMFRPTKLDIQ
jgi:hypothetical protein